MTRIVPVVYVNRNTGERYPSSLVTAETEWSHEDTLVWYGVVMMLVLIAAIIVVPEGRGFMLACWAFIAFLTTATLDVVANPIDQDNELK